jgi:hypothetical protein
MITQDKSGYHVKSEHGKNLGGPYKTREEAFHRLQQVEYFKHKTASLHYLGFAKIASEILGIPSRSIKTKPRELTTAELWSFNIQKHKAKHAGTHFDLRLVDPSSGIAHSWATRNLPSSPGEKVLAVHQPDHTVDYSTWEGNIASGYGAGNVSLFSSDKVEVTKSTADHITFNVYKTNGDTEHYTLVHTGGDDWLFFNTTPSKKTRPEINITKPKFQSVSPKTIDVNNSAQILAPKVDGAMNAFLLRKGKPIEVYSYRPSKKGPSKLIEHSFRTELYKTKTPESMRGSTVLLGELFARDTTSGRVLSNRDTSSRLLSNVWRSRELQKTAPIDNIVFDVVRYQGHDVSKKPYAEKLKILQAITREVPELKMPPLATNINDKQQLISEVSAGIHPLSQEGVVIYNLDKPVPTKAKIFNDYDVRIRDIFPGEGKYKGRGAGGFTYSHKGSNKVIGRVGSGFNDQMREQMFNDPRQFTGLVARVISQEKLPSGALRVPVFKDIRSESWPRTKIAVANKVIRKKIMDKPDATLAISKIPEVRLPKDDPYQFNTEDSIPVLGDTMTNWTRYAALDLKKINKEYILPSLVIGPVMGAGITAATSTNKEEFKKNVSKGITAGVVGDIATGAGVGLWNQRKNLTKLFKTKP